MLRTLDFSALTGPIDRTAATAFFDRVRRRPGYKTWSVKESVVAIVVFALLAIGSVWFLVAVVLFVVQQSNDEFDYLALSEWTGVVCWSLVALGVLAVGIAGVVGSIWYLRKPQDWYRLDAFARANDMVFSPSRSRPGYPGMLFTPGKSRLDDHIRVRGDLTFTYGTATTITGSGKNQDWRSGGYLALKLDRALPRMLLDARGNNFLQQSIATSISRDHVLELEGDFGDHFTLYCPKGYEQEALYIFTPDLMALLIDEASDYDVEIVDDWMFVYSVEHLNLLKPQVHERMLRIADTVGARIARRSSNFRAVESGRPGRPGFRPKTSVYYVVLTVVSVGLVFAPFAVALFGY